VINFKAFGHRNKLTESNDWVGRRRRALFKIVGVWGLKRCVIGHRFNANYFNPDLPKFGSQVQNNTFRITINIYGKIWRPAASHYYIKTIQMNFSSVPSSSSFETLSRVEITKPSVFTFNVRWRGHKIIICRYKSFCPAANVVLDDA
jgi:hypothetical protein